MAVWMLNRLIDKSPDMYIAWKELYLKEIGSNK